MEIDNTFSYRTSPNLNDDVPYRIEWKLADNGEQPNYDEWPKGDCAVWDMGYRDNLSINKYVNDKLQEVITVEEEVLTTAVVEALRQKGYIVIAPGDQEYDGL